MALVAHFKFNGNINNELSGYENTATSISYDPNGKINFGASFGSSSYATFNSTFQLRNIDNWTVSVWVKTTGTNMSILSNSSGGPVVNDLKIEDGKITYWHYDGAWQVKRGTIPVNDNKWHNLIWVNFSHNRMNMYVDGILDVKMTASTIINNAGPIDRLGRNWAGNNFVGLMDELKIYNDADLSKINQLAFNKELVRHWPMLGNLNDVSGNGIMLLNPSGTNTAINAGKIGQALTKTSGYYLSNINNPSDDLTISMWFRHNGTNWLSECLFGTRVGNDGFMFYRNDGDTDGYYRIYFWYNSTSNTVNGYNTWPGISGLAADTWYHVTMVRKSNGNLRFYLNGNLSYSGTPPADFSSWHNNGATLAFHGQGNGSSYTDGDISFNDIRVYNYAISEKEVKNISKTLLLNYTFNDRLEDASNNLINAIVPSYNNWGTNTGTSGFITNMYGSRSAELNITSFTDGGIQWYSSGGLIPVSPSTVYTVSARVKYTTNPHQNMFYLRQYNSGGSQLSEGGIYSASNSFEDEAGYKIAFSTFTTRSDAFFVQIQGYQYSINRIEMNQLQLEQRSHYSPHSNLSRASQVLDLSGYKQHAVKVGEFSGYNFNNKIGSLGANFSGGIVDTETTRFTHIRGDQDITICAWVYATSFANGWNGILTTMSGWGTGFSMQIGINQKIALMIQGNYLTTSWAPQLNTWYHIVGTRNASTNVNKLYVNGILENQATIDVTYASDAVLKIGSFYNTGSLPFYGIIDNIKVYGTELSQDDVLDLYQTRASLDNQGNAYSHNIDTKVNLLNPELFTFYSNNSKDPGYDVVDGRSTWRVFPSWYHPNASMNYNFKSNTQYEYNIWIKHSSYWSGGPYYVPGGLIIKYTDSTETLLISGGAIQDWVNIKGVTPANKTIKEIAVYYFVSYEVKIDTRSYISEVGSKEFNSKGEGKFIYINEVDEIEEKQQIEQDGSFIIKGQYSEVD